MKASFFALLVVLMCLVSLSFAEDPNGSAALSCSSYGTSCWTCTDVNGNCAWCSATRKCIAFSFDNPYATCSSMIFSQLDCK